MLLANIMIIKGGVAISTVGYGENKQHVVLCITEGILTFTNLMNNIYTTEFLSVVVSAQCRCLLFVLSHVLCMGVDFGHASDTELFRHKLFMQEGLISPMWL
jgi:hypothetical protein